MDRGEIRRKGRQEIHGNTQGHSLLCSIGSGIGSDRGDYDTDRVKFMVTQKVGDEFEEGMKIGARQVAGKSVTPSQL